jgi:fucose permease
MSPKTKVFIYQFLSFAIIFIPLRYLIAWLAKSEGMWIPFLAFIVTIFIAPKFQVVQTKEGSKIWMKWFFSKNIKEL